MKILPLRKALLNYAIGILLLILATIAITVWIAVGQLVQPNRRPLQEYQRDWIDQPFLHGIRIHSYGCGHGMVPCLIVVPDAHAGPGKRGEILRNQLASQGVALQPYGETQGILVLLHGRTGRKEDLLPVAERFAAAGFKCVIPDLPGHGDNPQFSTGTLEQAFASNVLADARNILGDQTSPAGIWGLSMGGAYAVGAVARASGDWKAMVIVSSFDSLEGVMSDRLASWPILFPATSNSILMTMADYRSGLSVQKVLPAQWASNIHIPVLVAHGDRDHVIRPERGQRLFSAFGSSEKAWITVPGADHNNILITTMPLYAIMSEWLIIHVK